MTAASVPKQLVGGRVAHKPSGKPYAHGANREFIRDASKSKADFEGVDLDLTVSLELTGWVNHWEEFLHKDAWYDPKRRLSESARISKTRNADLSRVRVNYQGTPRPMLTAKQAAVFCRDVKPRRLIPCFEAKTHRVFFDVEWWVKFKAYIPANCQPVIMSLPGSHNAGARKLQAAYEAGLTTMWIWRGTPPKGFEKYTDLVKSRPGHPIYRV